MSEHAAAAHPDLTRESTDGQARQPFDRGQPHGGLEDGGMGLLTIGAALWFVHRAVSYSLSHFP